jgi:hypothetical protein
VVDRRAWPCGCGGDEHAKAYSIKQLPTLRKLLRRAYQEPDTFAFRKVDNSVSMADITPALGNTFSDGPPTIRPCDMRLVLMNASGDMHAAVHAAEQEAPRCACGQLTHVPLSPSQQQPVANTTVRRSKRGRGEDPQCMQPVPQQVADSATLASVRQQNRQDGATGRVLHCAMGVLPPQVRLLHAMPLYIHLG